MALKIRIKVYQTSILLLVSLTEALNLLLAKINKDSSINEHLNNLKNIDKLKGKISVIKDSRGLKIMK